MHTITARGLTFRVTTEHDTDTPAPLVGLIQHRTGASDHAAELDACLMHAATCAGLMDSEN